MKIGVLKNFAKFTGKHLCQILFLNKVAGLRPATLLKKRLWYRCFPVNFAKCLRAPSLQNISKRVLLNIMKLKASLLRLLVVRFQFYDKSHCVKCVQIRSFSGIQSECGKIRTRKNSVFGHFSHSVRYQKCTNI